MELGAAVAPSRTWMLGGKEACDSSYEGGGLDAKAQRQCGWEGWVKEKESE